MNWNVTFDSWVTALRVTPSGLFAGGVFHVCNGAVTLSLAKLDLTTGSRAQGFDAQAQNPGAVLAIARQPDGKLIIGGDFWFAGGLPRQHLARVKVDGTLDPFWAPNVDGTVFAIAVSGTNAFVGGAFQKIAGLNRTNLAKLSTQGNDAIDPSWDAKIRGGIVQALALDDTNLFVGGSSLGGTAGKPDAHWSNWPPPDSALLIPCGRPTQRQEALFFLCP